MINLNYYNQLVDYDCDYKQENFKQSLKYNQNGICFSKILKDLSENNIKYSIAKGFDYLSNDQKISLFKRVILYMNKENFEKTYSLIKELKYNVNLEYYEDDENISDSKLIITLL